MKFGQQLEELIIPKYRGYYIQYKELKKAIKVWLGVERNQSTVQEVTHWTSSFLRCGPNPETTPEKRLQELLSRELDRVATFAKLEEDALRAEMKKLEGECQKKNADPKMLDDLIEQVDQLRSFTRVNFTGFRKIMKKYDKRTKSATTRWFMTKVARSDLMHIDYDGFLLSVSRIATALRQQQQQEVQPKQQPPQVQQPLQNELDFSVQGSQEMVFFIDPKETLWVKMRLAKHLTPAVLSGSTTKLDTPQRLAQTSLTEFKDAAQKSRTLSFFLDTPDLRVYRAYASGERAETSQDVQAELPYAGCHVRSDEKTGGVACVVHDQESSAGRALALPVDKVKNLIFDADVDITPGFEGQIPGSVASCRSRTAGDDAQAVLQELKSTISTKVLRPKALASYFRSIFHQKEASRILAVLDEDIRIAQCDGLTPSGFGECLSIDVLTVTLQPGMTAADIPQWLCEFNGKASLVPVPGFSKAVQSLGHFFAARLGLPLPHWYQSSMSSDALASDRRHQDLEKETAGSSDVGSRSEEAPDTGPTDVLTGKSPEEDRIDDIIVSHADPRVRVFSGTGSQLLHDYGAPELMSIEDAVARPLMGNSGDGGFAIPSADTGSLETSLLSGGTTQLPVRKAIVSVQPKTIFSNERTFLEWVHMCIIMATAGLGVLHVAPSAGAVFAGRVIVLTAIFLVGWSLHTFNWRAGALDQKEITDYEDPVGPPLLVGIFLVGLAGSSMAALNAI